VVLAQNPFVHQIESVKTITIEVDDQVYADLQKVAGTESLSAYIEKLLQHRAEASATAKGGTGWMPVEPIPFRPPGYFAECYSDTGDAAFEERICSDSKPVIEA